MTCQEAVSKLYEYLDKELDQITASKVEKHLRLCRLCCDNYELEKSMKKLLRESCVDEKAPPFLKDKIVKILN